MCAVCACVLCVCMRAVCVCVCCVCMCAVCAVCVHVYACACVLCVCEYLDMGAQGGSPPHANVKQKRKIYFILIVLIP
jgi:hypothetical protein